MKRRVTMREIGRHAGVSHTTVSYVLSGKGEAESIPQETQEHVRSVAEQLGWQPNQLVSAFFNGKSFLIGLWVTSMGDPYHSWVMRKMEKILHEDDYALLISPAHAKGEGTNYDLALFNRWAVDGLIGLDGPAHILRFLGSHPRWHMPMVSMGSFALRDDPRVDSVYVDVLGPVREALDRWYDEGKKHFAMLSGYGVHDEILHPREECYRAFVREQGLKEVMIRFPMGGSVRESAQVALREHLAKHECPEVIFSRSDGTMIAACKVLREQGYVIPDDVALLGIDGIQETHFLPSSVSTVVQPVEDMCRLGWSLLKDRIEHPNRPSLHKTLRGKLEWRVGGASKESDA